MDYIHYSIYNRVKVAVGVLLILLFGFLAVFTIPIQLVPNVDQPVITVTTAWTGKDPQQIEQDILEEQEDVLKRVSNLRKMTATASQNMGEVRLEFYVGTDMTRAVQEVSDKLREVPSYPEDVDEPVITVADSASQNAIAWMVLRSGDPDFDVESIRDRVEERVKPYLERAAGISQINVYGGRDREVHVQVDPRRLALRGITFSQLEAALRSHNVNVSAGAITEGRLDKTVRAVGQYDNLADIRQTVVVHTAGGPIRVSDVADVVLTLEERRGFVRAEGEPALALNAIRESGSNVITAMRDLKERIDYVNTVLLPDLGPDLTLKQVYDETQYIYAAIDLVLDNLWIGGSLAVLVLGLFLRRYRPTLIIAVAIPISVIGTFVIMTGAGRNLNVVSLAGLAFAVGMVVDNAIVVLENIDRHLEMGEPPLEAAYRGTSEVWGAILASTLTTLAVFIPVLFMEEEAGQLFRDLALAICASVGLSLIVSITVIPTAAARFLRPRAKGKKHLDAIHSLFGIATLGGKLNRAYVAGLHKLTAPNFAGVAVRLLIVAAFTLIAIVLAAVLMPPTSYLPSGNRNLVFGMMFTPPAYSTEHNMRIADRVESRLRPYWEADSRADLQGLPPVLDFTTGQPVEPAPIDTYFFVTFNGMIFMGGTSQEEEVVAPLATLLNQAMGANPGSFGFAFQPSIFGEGAGGANAIEVEILGDDIDAVRNTGDALFGGLMGLWNKPPRPDPGNFNLPAPELQVKIDPVRASDVGVTVANLGLGVASMIDGSIVGDYKHHGDTLDLLMIRHPDYPLTPQTLGQIPLAVQAGAVGSGGGAGGGGTGGGAGGMSVVPLSSVATVAEEDAPQQIKRIEETRAVVLTVEPPAEVALEAAQEQIEGMVAGMRQRGAIPPSVDVRMAGTADKLTEVRRAMLGAWHGWNVESLLSLLQSRMFLALLVTYLLMAALFESFVYPLVILFAVPLAAVGGFMGLAIVHHYIPTQQLDVLAMLGFVILIGVVVNNAILIVHQALNFMKGYGESEADRIEPLPPREAIAESVRTRIRPIFMTTITSVVGMLPLVVMPGSGSELYRGLGSVVLGGLIVATVFTLVVIPLLFSLVLDARRVLSRLIGFEAPELVARTKQA